MRRLFPFLVLAASGCSDRPNAEQTRLIADVEAHVVMPKGAGRPQCYARYYMIVDADGSESIFGVKLHDGRFLFGEYRREEKPGVHWLASPKDRPAPLYDAGCDAMSVLVDLDRPGGPIEASCSPSFAGNIPASVDPPVHC